MKWYRKAADQGYANAQHNLGGMYRYGIGVIKDEQTAYMWYLLASAKGNENARANIDIIEKQLTSEQRATVQRMAREWKPTTAGRK